MIYAFLLAELGRIVVSRSWRVVAGLVIVIAFVSTYTLGQTQDSELTPAWSQVGSISGNAAAFLLCVAAYDTAAAFRDGIDVPSIDKHWRLKVQMGRMLAVWAIGVVGWISCVLVAVAGGIKWVDAFTWEKAHSGGMLRLMLGGLGSTLSMGVLGVAMGVLVRRPGLAVGVALGWFALVENTLSALLGQHERLLPGRASSVLLEHEFGRSESAFSAGIVLASWCLGLAFFSAFRLRRVSLL